MSEAAGRYAVNIGPTTRSTSTGNRFSTESTDTGESSKQSSIDFDDVAVSIPNAPSASHRASLAAPAQNGSENHRSHRSRSSGGFLLSNTTFEVPPKTNYTSTPSNGNTARRREPPKDHKGKVQVQAPERKHAKKPSHGLGIGGSPLAANVTSAAQEHVSDSGVVGGDSAQETKDEISAHVSSASKTNGLDVDSAQIVNLALNLSESRKIVARRNVSTPLPPTVTSFGDGTVGGSLRQYLQQQRRSSRNISPKPDRGDRAFTASPRGPQGLRLDSPLQAAFGGPEDTEYQYHFSASTLARAEKAKKAIELMAQYRNLLQYVPPLKPQIQTRAVTRSPPNTAPGSPTNPGVSLSRTSSATVVPRPLGRPYNPLQYIRNRKVRARERKGIDGELQGFGDVEKVTTWVQDVSKESASDGYRNSDCVALPPFSGATETARSPHASPQSTTGRSVNKIKRPRVDWMMNPADMLADIYWLEQNDNKKLIEDNRERKLFPQNVGLTRPVSRKGEEPVSKTTETEAKEEPKDFLPLDTELPKFNSLRGHPDHHHDIIRGRALHKLQKVAHLPEDLSRLGHEHRILKPRLRTSSESSNSDSASRTRHRRSGTADTQDLSSDILEKQMMEILQKEASENSRAGPQDVDGQNFARSMELDESELREDASMKKGRKPDSSSVVINDGHHRKDSLKPSGDSQQSSKRASLDVPRHNGRTSMDGLDITAPNSPEAQAARIKSNLIPPIGLDLSPPPSRGSSPVRKPALERMKSKINPFHDRGRNHSRSRSLRGDTNIEDDKATGRTSLEIPFTPLHRRKRSESPQKKIIPHKPDESVKSTSSKGGSVRRRAEDLPSGIKGLFKGGRNPVSRVGDLLWRKEASTASGVSSNTSTDYSDLEDETESSLSRNPTVDSTSNPKSRDTSGETPQTKETRSYDLPTFTSPFERRGRTEAIVDDTESPESDYLSKRQRTRENRKNSRFQLLKPPRIDVQNASPSSSPDFTPADRRSSRNSDFSDFVERRRSSYGVQGADARLNSILGIPGSAFTRLPVTALSKLEENRRPSMTGKRQWSSFDRGASSPQMPVTRRELARLRALLLSSGIKANQIAHRGAHLTALGDSENGSKKPNIYAEVAAMNRDPQVLHSVPRFQEHLLAAQILSNDIKLSSRLWEESADNFNSQAVGNLLDRIDELQDRIMGPGGLSDMTRVAADDADNVSRDLVTGQTMKVKALQEKMRNIMRRRRARFRWVRRGGWVMLEWVLVGVMWWAWLIVVLIQVVRGMFGGALGAIKWLFWL